MIHFTCVPEQYMVYYYLQVANHICTCIFVYVLIKSAYLQVHSENINLCQGSRNPDSNVT